VVVCLRVSSLFHLFVRLFWAMAHRAQMASWPTADTIVNVLDLEGNMIGNDGAAALADVFKTVTSLRHVDLGTNSIGKDGCFALASWIQVLDCRSPFDCSL
jgi:hypothetical protein